MPGKVSLHQLKRRLPSKAPKLRVALVCEGEKTERLYFSLFTDDLQAANVKLQVMERKCGSDPLSVVQYGKEVFDGDEGIDTCFCVIDRDTHATFASAMALASAISKKTKGKRRFRTIVSYPCFEIWFILHFSASRKPYTAEKNRSAGDNAVADLKLKLPDYEKSNIDSMRKLLDNTPAAIKYSKIVLNDAVDSGDLNPSTEVHLLIEYLFAAKGGVIPDDIQKSLWPE